MYCGILRFQNMGDSPFGFVGIGANSDSERKFGC